ncbi:MAG: DUF2332 family protein [Caldimonas sp.]
MASPELLRAFDRQAESCKKLDASFTAEVVETLAQQLRDGGPLAGLLTDWPGDPNAHAVPLRLCGALHALALHPDSSLGALYPPRASKLDREALIRELDDALRHDRAFFERMLQQPPQTNEIGRSAVLLGGFAEIARNTGLPLALLEIGASAGLNLRWDRYRFELGLQSWGDAASSVRIASQWRGSPPVLPSTIDVAERAGCDRAPLDPREQRDRRCLLSYCWPEQQERVERLTAALELASSDDLVVERVDAAQWLEKQLAHSRPGVATVVYHSIVWQYLAEETQKAVRAAIEQAGARATNRAPVAWLRLEFEAEGHPPELTLTQWPGGARRRLATAHPHGAHAEWSVAKSQ